LSLLQVGGAQAQAKRCAGSYQPFVAFYDAENIFQTQRIVRWFYTLPSAQVPLRFLHLLTLQMICFLQR
jgi:hypothetical protein